MLRLALSRRLGVIRSFALAAMDSAESLFGRARKRIIRNRHLMLLAQWLSAMMASDRNVDALLPIYTATLRAFPSHMTSSVKSNSQLAG
jgi:hypothetical protein